MPVPVRNFWQNVPDAWEEGDVVPPGVPADDAETRNARESAILDYIEELFAQQISVLALTRVGALAVSAGVLPYVLPRLFICSSVQVAVGTVFTGASAVVDVNLDGVSIFGTVKPTITAGQKKSTGVAPAAPNLTTNGELTVDLDAIGAGGQNLSVFFTGRWSA